MAMLIYLAPVVPIAAKQQLNLATDPPGSHVMCPTIKAARGKQKTVAFPNSI